MKIILKFAIYSAISTSILIMALVQGNFGHKMTFPFGKVIQVVFIGIKTIFITFVGSSGKR